MEENKKNSSAEDLDEKLKENLEENVSEESENVDIEENANQVQKEDEKNEFDALKEELAILRNSKDKLQKEVDTLKDRLLRITAEYDNYRKRTSKEKEGIYTDACEDVLKEVLPIIDNLERAISMEGSAEDIKKGVEMTMKSFKDSLNKLNVEEIDADGNFDPNFHNAVMHVEDESLDPNVIVEVFQKGYKRGDKVLRYSMVKVAN
ncbi:MULTISPECIES: nucleotide exchange factor GrpE [Clostridium]|uniref:Protein GrpE n=1 Tax=Clostridium cadaveris TaxID=1529 RepID=A0A1I2JFC4_9CLOT|nr:nucleotide exchange factor GrpE [Clostridium cadaveris]MDU4951296.1 nucleotide exchange factor GrpE [Clostridium sp.]MDM8310739.1 nucleotide exchange factor GrpE [Clostridium cadaveris]MDY4948745.1 nucleotide exchange factor GrpE [Clostridium cadaveris]NME63860.1 nucleotide exchange factor GrpE [Clostridium cadaveris]NWK10467.1 nucleotide exchange factor GrpE [Clostridium cadaveris]